MKNTQRIQVAFQLEAILEKKIININRNICDKYPQAMVIDGKNSYPHLTIYPPEIPVKNLAKISTLLEKELEKKMAIGIVIKEIVYDKGYIMANIELTKEIINIHRQIIELINPLRENVIREKYLNLEYLQSLPIQQQKYIKEYGYQYIFENYHPHITIAYFEDIILGEKVMQELVNSGIQEELVGITSELIAINVYEALEKAQCGTIIYQNFL